ncbi:hypothetical protein [Massilia consociata]|uniref:Uncharacterized protein n=1 Tax=Massilia consociata TaxID=760117 RepID=A0ABV6FJG1_9BURK
MDRLKSLIQLGVILLALAVFGYFGAKYVGNMTQDSTLERLETVWPEFRTMPEQDRDFLIEASLTCNVLARPAVRADVVDCLRSTAPRLTPEAQAKLDALLKDR